MLQPAFYFPEERQVVIKATGIFCSQQSHINSLSESSTWTTSTRQSYYGIKSNTSMDIQLQSRPYYRCVPIFIAPLATSLSCYHRRIGWMPWQGDPTVDSPTHVRNDHSSWITSPILNLNRESPRIPYLQHWQFWQGISVFSHSASHPRRNV